MGNSLIKKLFKYYSFSDILFIEYEAFLFFLVDWLPGSMGVIARCAVWKLLLKNLSGFAFVQPQVRVVHANKLSVGRNFSINSWCYLNALGGIEIGDNVLIGLHVTLSSGKHEVHGVNESITLVRSRPCRIVISDDVFIGSGAIIMPGVKVAQGCVIGANAVVTHDTEPYWVYGGVPARKIKKRVK